MKATGIVRRIDDLGRVVIPKEIRRTMRIREGDPSQTTLETWQKFSFSIFLRSIPPLGSWGILPDSSATACAVRLTRSRRCATGTR